MLYQGTIQKLYIQWTKHHMVVTILALKYKQIITKAVWKLSIYTQIFGSLLTSVQSLCLNEQIPFNFFFFLLRTKT